MSGQTGSVLFLELGRSDEADGLEQSMVVEPPGVLEGGELDVLEP